jgi:predicted membrane channel-forming protein YqfA (hemolysin III family)
MRWKTLRLSTFVATGLSAFAPILHAASIFPYDQLDKQAGLRYYYLEGFLILIGVGFYAVWFSCLYCLLQLVPLLTRKIDPFPRVTKTQEIRYLGRIPPDIPHNCGSWRVSPFLWHTAGV